MSQFFFNVYDGKHLVDDEGMDLPSFKSACRAAISLSGALIKDDAARIADGLDWHIEVTDGAGLILYRLDFVVAASAAVSGGEQRQAQMV